MVATSIAHTETPSAQNCGLQTGDTSWLVAHFVPPTNNNICTSLFDTCHPVTVASNFQTDDAQTITLKLNKQDIGSIPN